MKQFSIIFLLILIAASCTFLATYPDKPALEKVEKKENVVGKKVVKVKDPHWVKFTEKHCISCHGPDKQKGKVRLDQLFDQAIDNGSYELLEEIALQVKSGDMPPKKKKQPSEQEKADFLNFLNKEMKLAKKNGNLKKPTVALKRLNRTQFRNTLRDLLYINTEYEDPILGFPDDRTNDHFNVMDKDLNVSDHLLQIYLKTAEESLAKVSFPEKPERKTVVYPAPSQKFLGGITVDHKYTDIVRSGYWGGGQVSTSWNQFKDGGYYNIKLDVEALYRDLKEQNHKLRHRYRSMNEEAKLRINLLTPRNFNPASSHMIAMHDLKDYDRRIIEHKIWIPKGWQLEFKFDNGPESPTWVQYQSLIDYNPPKPPKGMSKYEAQKLKEKYEKSIGYKFDGKIYNDFMAKAKTSRIRIHKLTIDGPIYDSWPPKSQEQIESNKTKSEILTSFAKRAFRRPVSKEEIQPFVRVAENHSMKMALKAIMVAPQFVYVNENDGKLNNHSLASRLSYALRVSMPDDQLTKLADLGKLTDKAVYNSEIKRLLSASHNEAFIESFVTQWLRLQSIHQVFPEKHRLKRHSKQYIMEEPKVLFKYMLENNLSIKYFIDSDFAFLNDVLANLYKVKGITGSQLRKVKLPQGSQRGGLLSMPAVLVASANGVDTSPVVRGIYLLENILGYKVPEPPEGIEGLNPDIRGSKSIRDLLEKHSSDESCFRCHKKIDPLGFALENFGPLGQIRTQYPDRKKIDTSGILPDGTQFKDISGLKKALLNDIDSISKNLVKMLLVYSTGREMGPLDEDEISRICRSVRTKDYGLKDLVIEVLNSEIVLHK